MPKLFEEDSDNDLKLQTDTDYAKNYNTWRKKEELHKLQARHGDIDVDSSSDSSSEDEEPDVNFDKDFFKTLSYLKTKDNRIYDKNYDFFGSTNDATSSKPIKIKKEQPMYIKDYERKLILENHGVLSDEDNETKPFTYNDEQNELKRNLKNALDDIEDGDDNENWGGLFKTREKTNEDEEKEEDEYLQWLAGQSKCLNNEQEESELKPLKHFWNDPKLEEGEKFLRDYILKKRFLDAENEDYVPTYDEIVHDSAQDFSEDEEAIDKQEEFEHKYNFRFEEPDQEFIKRYPRTLENSLRQIDDKRKVKRLERRERKADEKKQKMEDISKLKELKMLEFQEKISKLKEVTGNSEMAFDVKDFDDNFDPDEHDKLMQRLFNEEFYEGQEGEQKPEFPDLDEELELENWDRWHGEDNTTTQNEDETQPHCEDENFNMDCDYDPTATTQQELINNSKRQKKRRRKSKFAKVLSEPKPIFDPNNLSYQQYLDEYYKLDCEDVIGDIPCRFKYRRVVPNDFGLSVEEILTAKDKELNRWCSLKKTLQHRPEHIEKYDVIAYSKKAQNTNLKRKYLPSLFEHEDCNPNENEAAEKLPNKPKKKSSTSTDVTSVQDQPPIQKVETISMDEDKNANKSLEVTKKEKKKNSNKHTKVDIKLLNTNDSASTQTNLKNKNGKRKHKIPSSNDHGSDDNPPKKHKQKSFNNKKLKLKGNKAQLEIGISDARLAAYGFKPKKFKNKLKYGNTK